MNLEENKIPPLTIDNQQETIIAGVTTSVPLDGSSTQHIAFTTENVTAAQMQQFANMGLMLKDGPIIPQTTGGQILETTKTPPTNVGNTVQMIPIVTHTIPGNVTTSQPAMGTVNNQIQYSLTPDNILKLQNQMQAQMGQGIQQNMDTNMLSYMAALANPNVVTGNLPVNNLLMGNNSLVMTANGPQLIPNTTTNFQLDKTQNAAMIGNPPITGPRAYDLLAVYHLKKWHPVKRDIDRLKHLKAMKSKLVNKVFQPLDYRHAFNYRLLQKIPGWHSAANKERLRKWGIRGAELFRQTLLLDIEAEMVKVKSVRDLVFQDELAGGPNFEMVSTVRKDLNL